MGQRRKVRSDKKVEVQPWISVELRKCIHRLNYITKVPIKDIGEEVCMYGLNREKVVSYLSQYFKHNIRFNNTVYLGDEDAPSVKKRAIAGMNKPISIRFKQDTYKSIKALSDALECTPSRACALLLDASVRDVDFINGFVENYLKEKLDDHRMSELKKVLKYLNQNNPYDEDISWASLFSYMVEEVKIHAEKAQKTVSNFIINQWDK